MKKQELKDNILKWAYEYAKTGEYEDYQAIERRLRFEDGYSDARKILDDYFIREELDELCKEARKNIKE